MKLAIEWTDITVDALQRALDSVTTALSLKKETNHTLKVAASVTPDTDGGDFSLLAGDGSATNSGGGDIIVDAGAKQGSGTSGVAKLGRTAAEAVEIGRTTKMTTVKGTLNVDEAVTLDSTMVVTGAATLNGAVTLGDALADVVTVNGRVDVEATDSSGTPGAATINKVAGRSAIALGAASVVITNSLVTAASLVFAQLATADATATFIKSVVPGAGSFTITVNATATADTNVNWWVITPS